MAIKYKPKPVKFSHICKNCLKSYTSADIKGTYCIECKKPRQCKCGCLQIVKTPGKEYARGCRVRGKTYSEIYGTDSPSCGFKKGENNPMASPISKLKQSEAIKKSYTDELRRKRSQYKLNQLDQGLIYGKMRYENSKGEKFRSILELKVSDILAQNNISYEYEKAVFKLPNNSKGYKRKVVDFRINNVLLEVSGLAYTKWIEEFIEKINLLKLVTTSKIIILTYKDKVDTVKVLEDDRTFIFNLFDLEKNFHILQRHLI